MERMQYGHLDLNLLLVLERLLARRSVTLAAADLGLSQPATSRALQRLRDALGDPLLVRAGREMILTDRAQALAGPAVAALEAAGQVFAPAPAFDPLTATGPVVLGLGDDTQAAFLRTLYRRFRAESPGLDLRVRAVSEATVDEGRRGLLDLVLAPDLSALPAAAGAVRLDEFVTRPLYTRRFAVIADRTRWPEPPSLAAYLRAEHVIVSFEAGGRGFVDDLLEQQGARRRVALAVTSFAAMAQVVVGSDLLAVAPWELVTDDRLIAHPPPLALPPLPMLLIWHPRQTTQPRHRFLRALFTQVVQEAVAGLSPPLPPP